MGAPPREGGVQTGVTYRSAGEGWIVEVQLQPDREKELSWLIYLAVVSARPVVRGGVVTIVVVTLCATTERWAIATLGKVIPKAGRWRVIGPMTMVRVTDPVEAAQHPELAILSGLILAGAKDDEDLVPAIAIALSTIRGERGMGSS